MVVLDDNREVPVNGMLREAFVAEIALLLSALMKIVRILRSNFPVEIQLTCSILFAGFCWQLDRPMFEVSKQPIGS